MTAPAAGDERTTVAVGYDGSEAAQAAVRWAAEYAASGGYRLRVVHAWVWPIFTKKLGPVKGVEGSGLRHGAEVVLAEGVDLARTAIADAQGRAAQGRSAQGSAAPSAPAGGPGKRRSPVPASRVSWKPASRLRCCAMPPVTPASWWSAAADSAACWGTWPDRSVSTWPAPPPAL